ncbi:glutathione S-transferase family protein [Pseudomonas cavernae]|uniref:Glutathione S-transferase family protein n=1 Tax=Pseudomonas cavernae TaxID=2320867 RepID=A0A385Z5W8_9PSED|nr:glutathione S-transferase family protein [Pseudomonas cavernae]AYC33467.1 glutathione S-transferase family protein [Pseudomonas cavernae]
MKLHDFALSGNAYKVRLFLGLIGQEVELASVDLLHGAHKHPDFLAINPRGQVPVLEDDDFRLGDSQAILVYLASRYAEAAWYPLDAISQGRIAHWLSFAANEVQHGVAQARLLRLFNRPGDLEAVQAKGRAALELLEAHLVRHAWLAQTETPTIADIAVYPYVAMAVEGGLELDSYRNLQAWFARLRALPGYQPLPSR